MSKQKLHVMGECHWAKLSRRQAENNEGKFELEICQLTPESIESLKQHGVDIKEGTDEKSYKGQFITAKTQYPPKVFDKKPGAKFDAESTGIGNGSKVRCEVTPYEWTKGAKSGTGAGLEAVVILDLVEYSGASEAFSSDTYQYN